MTVSFMKTELWECCWNCMYATDRESTHHGPETCECAFHPISIYLPLKFKCSDIKVVIIQ